MKSESENQPILKSDVPQFNFYLAIQRFAIYIHPSTQNNTIATYSPYSGRLSIISRGDS